MAWCRHRHVPMMWCTDTGVSRGVVHRHGGVPWCDTKTQGYPHDVMHRYRSVSKTWHRHRVSPWYDAQMACWEEGTACRPCSTAAWIEPTVLELISTLRPCVGSCTACTCKGFAEGICQLVDLRDLSACRWTLNKLLVSSHSPCGLRSQANLRTSAEGPQALHSEVLWP